MILELTRKQEERLKLAVQRYKAGEPWTCIKNCLILPLGKTNQYYLNNFDI